MKSQSLPWPAQFGSSTGKSVARPVAGSSPASFSLLKFLFDLPTALVLAPPEAGESRFDRTSRGSEEPLHFPPRASRSSRVCCRRGFGIRGQVRRLPRGES